MSMLSRAYQHFNRHGLKSLSAESSRFALRKLLEPTYGIGSRRLCPVCGFTGWRFSSTGTPRRPEALCPVCGATERHRFLWHYIEHVTSLTEGNNDILYFAPTTGIPEKLRANGNTVVTSDLMMPHVNVTADITALPFADEALDAIICSHVLEHVLDDRAAMSEMHRVLNSEGEALIVVPKDTRRERTHEDESITSPEARRSAFGTKYHVRLYGRDFERRLYRSGFDVSVETYGENIDDELIDSYRLETVPDHRDWLINADVHHCTKRVG